MSPQGQVLSAHVAGRVVMKSYLSGKDDFLLPLKKNSQQIENKEMEYILLSIYISSISSFTK